jgi:hypothetical protein
MPPTLPQLRETPDSDATSRTLPDADAAPDPRRPIVHSAMTSGTPMPKANSR